uniref:Mitogen-activated protein kinase 8 interacting protein 1 n=1 Tax=Takifugu rubripes TaxID=31033 RepID=A0A3B5KH03_TAKRU
MADREKRKASPPSGRSARLNSPASFRLTHDISLDEFEDDDLSEITEITDERGMSLNCNGPDLKGHMRRGTNSVSGRAELGAVGQLQAEMLHLELIDGADGFRGDIDSSKPSIIAAPVLIKDPAAPVTMDTYRPKRPTTLNLFPIVPRTQDTLNNNSFGKKYSWQEKVSGSSSPLKAGAESFGLYSCVIHGEEKDQSHRAVYRFVPRHDDELELEVDDPLLVEVQSEDYWYEGYNMRTGARGIFPAYYAIEVSKDPEIYRVKSGEWMDRYRLKFLGSVQVPYHKGNDVLCAAMQKIATNRRMTVEYNPPSSCILDISVKGIKLSVQEDYYACDRSNECNHFFQLKNVSFCGYHPKNNKYFGFITKHPADHRFACHVFVSEDSTKAVAESVGKAFQLYYKEFVEASCPTEDIYLE